MRPLPQTAALIDLAPHIIWFEPPEQALADPTRFLADLMTYGTLAEIAVVRRYVELDDFRETLERAPPGIMDERSWAYWNLVCDRRPAPPLPVRFGPQSASERRPTAISRPS